MTEQAIPAGMKPRADEQNAKNSALLPCPFWSKVQRSTPDLCWEWQAAKNAKGYGNYRSRSAHVVSYEMENGCLPPGLEVDHTCKNRSCVNPAHLEAVTHQENVRRAQPSHCIRGHPLSGDNIKYRHRADGIRRVCKACHRIHKSNKAKRNG